jgi:dihydrofolate reductase
MRKLIMWNILTLDGYFEGPKSWTLDWHDSVWGEELERLSVEQLNSADMLLFGRVTYEGMAGYWRTAKGESAEIAELMNSIPKVVFSRTLGEPEWANTTLVKENAAAKVLELKQQGDRNMFVFGSADLSASFVNEGLFDEYRLALAPIILGSGSTLFGRNLNRRKLKLLESRPLSSGGVLLRYAPDRSQ